MQSSNLRKFILAAVLACACATRASAATTPPYGGGTGMSNPVTGALPSADGKGRIALRSDGQAPNDCDTAGGGVYFVLCYEIGAAWKPAVGDLRSDGSIDVVATLTFDPTSATDTAWIVDEGGTDSISAEVEPGNVWLKLHPSSGADRVLGVYDGAFAYPAFEVWGTGALKWGPTNDVTDTTLGRDGVNSLLTLGDFTAQGDIVAHSTGVSLLSTGIDLNNTTIVGLTPGSYSAPSLVIEGDADTGLYSADDNTVGLAAHGEAGIDVLGGATGNIDRVKVFMPLELLDLVGTTNIRLAVDTGRVKAYTTGNVEGQYIAGSAIDFSTAGNLNATHLGGTAAAEFLKRDGTVAMTGAFDFGNQVLKNVTPGTYSSPALYFQGDADTGLYSGTTDSVGLTGHGEAGIDVLGGVTANIDRVKVYMPLEFDDLTSTIDIRMANDSGKIKTYTTGNVEGAYIAGSAIDATGLNADTVDGLDAASFLRSDADDTGTGAITLTPGAGKNAWKAQIDASNYMQVPVTATDVYLEVRNGSASDRAIQMQLSGESYERFVLKQNGDMAWGPGSSTADVAVVRQSSPLGLYTAQSITASTFYGNLSGTASSATNADTVDSLHASSFLRADAADTGTGTITFDPGDGNVAWKAWNDLSETLQVQTSASDTYLEVRNANDSDRALQVQRSDQSFVRWQVKQNGDMAWGAGTGAPDVSVTRVSSPLGLSTAQAITAGAFYGPLTGNVTGNLSGTATNADALDSLDSSKFVRSDTADTASGTITFTPGDGSIGWKATNVATDTLQVQTAVDAVYLQARNGSDADLALQLLRSDQSYAKFYLQQNGNMAWGPGTGAADVGLSRSSSPLGLSTAQAIIANSLLSSQVLDMQEQISDGGCTTGDYRFFARSDGTPRIRVCVNGAASDLGTASGALLLNGTTTMSASAQIKADDGDAVAPGIVNGADLDTGIYFTATPQIAFATAGVARAFISSTGLWIYNAPLLVDQAATAGSFAVTSGPTLSTASLDLNNVPIIDLTPGTSSSPGLRMNNDADTGLYSNVTDSVGLAGHGEAGIDVLGGVTANIDRVKVYMPLEFDDLVSATDIRMANDSGKIKTYTTGNVEGAYIAGSAIDGSTLTASNADALDSLDSTAFLRANANDTATGKISFDPGDGNVAWYADNNLGEYMQVTTSVSDTYLQIRNGGASDRAIDFQIGTESYPRLQIKQNGDLAWGPGSGSPSTSVVYSAALDGLVFSDSILAADAGVLFYNDSDTGIYSGGSTSNEVRILSGNNLTAKLGNRAMQLYSTAGTAANYYVNLVTPSTSSLGYYSFQEDGTSVAHIQWRSSTASARPNELNLQTSIGTCSAGNCGDIRLAPGDGSVAAIAIDGGDPAGSPNDKHVITMTADDGIKLDSNHRPLACEYFTAHQIVADYTGGVGETMVNNVGAHRIISAAFDSASDECGQIAWQAPYNYAGSLQVSVDWTIFNPASNCNVAGNLDDICLWFDTDGYNDAGSMTSLAGTAVYQTDSCQATGSGYTLFRTAPVSVATTGITAGDFALLAICRDTDGSTCGGSGTDDMPTDALVVGVEVCYKIGNVMTGESP